jgi:hypothetical protein
MIKNEVKYICNYCKYSTNNKYDFTKHNNTLKHIKNTNTVTVQNMSNNEPNKQHYCNNCNKQYKDFSGLWKHKKTCNQQVTLNGGEEEKDLILQLVKQNTELMDLLKMTHSTNNQCQIANNMNNYNTNTNNNTFNLQFFLNETCKNAMNITEFVDSIKLQISDLENVAELGYIKGISNIITSNLRALDVSQRPIHCTDKKREILYVKDQDKWERDDDNKNKIRRAIRKISDKNVMLLPEFKSIYPECSKSSSKISDKYNKMIVEAMGGEGDDNSEKENKIIKNITNVTCIDKEQKYE